MQERCDAEKSGAVISKGTLPDTLAAYNTEFKALKLKTAFRIKSDMP